MPVVNAQHALKKRSRVGGRLTAAIALAAMIPVLLAVVQPAGAATIKKAIWGPATVSDFREHYCPLGVGLFEYGVNWATVAPTRPANPEDPNDPAYQWPAEIDTAIVQGQACGIQVALMLIGSPPWANGGGPYNVPPTSDLSFAQFAVAASKRYPAVRHWMIWGEPNRPGNWSLTRPTARLRIGKKFAAAPRRYATLLDTAYGALKSVNPGNIVIGGMTYTGGPNAFASLTWLRYMRLRNGKPPRYDMYGHNPFTTRKPRLKKRQIKRAFADFSDLDVLFKELDRYQRRGKRRPRVFISEFSVPTDISSDFLFFHTSRATQAKWIRAALRITRKTKRIYTLGWYTLYDLPPSNPGGAVGWGLLTSDGTRKPGWYAFQQG
jgi:hypothetical protein